MRLKFNYLVWLAAFILAGCAAFVSVFGLGKLFAGAGSAVLVMVGGLEFAKLVAASALHRYWDKLSVFIKVYMTIGVITLISITSMGIYGFLSDGYQKTANKLGVEESSISVIASKKSRFEKSITDNDIMATTKRGQKDSKSKRISQIENRRDTLLSRGVGTTRERNDIKELDKDIKQLDVEIAELSRYNSQLSDSVGFYESKISEIRGNSEIASEVGPLKYLSEVSGIEMNRVVNYLIIIIMLVFDPMAITLLIVANRIAEIEGQSNPKRPLPSEPVYEEYNTEYDSDDDGDDLVNEPEGESYDIEDNGTHIVNTEVIPEIETVIDKKPHKKLPVIPTGKISKEDLIGIKEALSGDRGFSVKIPNRKS